MNKIYKTIIFLISIISIYKPSFSNEIGLSQEIYLKLCGVWDDKVFYNTTTQLSWGEAKVSNSQNHSIIIDLGKEPIFFQSKYGFPPIKSIVKIGSDYIIKISTANMINPSPENTNKEYDMKITVIDENTLFFHRMEWNKNYNPIMISPNQKGIKLFRVDGPKVKYFKPKIQNLRLRTEPSLKGSVIRLMTKEEKMLIIKMGKNESVDGVKGTWVRVLTDKDEIGWCFDSYLESY